MPKTSPRQLRDLILILARKEVKTRYKNNFLGYLWSLANPLAYSVIFYFAFQVIFRFKVENYALFLICGLFPWQWLNNSIVSSTYVFLNNVNLIKKAVFPRYVLPVANCIQDGFHFIMTIPVILAFMWLHDVRIDPIVIIGVPILFSIQFAMLVGLSMLVGTLNVFFRDIEYMVQILFQMLFYLTPILYPLSKVPEEYMGFILLNPFSPIILSWKELFLHGQFDSTYLTMSILYAGVSVGLGVVFYKRLSWKFAEAI